VPPASADAPNLRHAAGRTGLIAISDAVAERHKDMYIYTTRSLRLPISGMGLKDIAAHFGIRRQSSISDGMEALMRYEEYRGVRNKNKKRALRDELVATISTTCACW
jgi:uncharacterized protein YprB with RNaseH-like and TPR domain